MTFGGAEICPAILNNNMAIPFSVFCEDWQEGLAYFLDPKTIRKMKCRGLHVVKMDAKKRTVYLVADDQDDMPRIIESISILETRSKSNPSPARAVNTMVPSASL